MDNRKCWLCGATNTQLHRHHIFPGKNRALSEKYGLVVYLCWDTCHEYGPNSAHKSKYTRQKLSEYGQKKAMQEQGWTAEEFIHVFGKNYLEE